MPDIVAMPVVRKTTAIVKQLHTLLFEELDKVCQAPYPRSLLSRILVLPILESTKIPYRLIAHSQIPKVGIVAVI